MLFMLRFCWVEHSGDAGLLHLPLWQLTPYGLKWKSPSLAVWIPNTHRLLPAHIRSFQRRFTHAKHRGLKLAERVRSWTQILELKTRGKRQISQKTDLFEGLEMMTLWFRWAKATKILKHSGITYFWLITIEKYCQYWHYHRLHKAWDCKIHSPPHWPSGMCMLSIQMRLCSCNLIVGFAVLSGIFPNQLHLQINTWAHDLEWHEKM